MLVLVTGTAGFIGMHLSLKLLELGFNVVGVDNLNNYYDLNLKLARLKNLKKFKKSFQFFETDLKEKEEIKKIFNNFDFNVVINLAAQAGVRYSRENPDSYIDSNILGFFNILEACRHNNISHLIYASSSSVYGLNSNTPFNESDDTNHPISLYGATKKSNEMMAHSYSYLYGIPTTGLRFFTVYGPWGRPDMAPFVFAKAIIEGKPIFLYNHGNMIRDFTYVDDIIEAISKLIKKPPIENNIIKSNKEASLNKLVPNKVFNIGKGDPISIHYFVELLENKLNKKAIIKMEQHQLGDVKKTEANTSSLENWIKFRPNISIERGVEKFIDWFIAYHRNS